MLGQAAGSKISVSVPRGSPPGGFFHNRYPQRLGIPAKRSLLRGVREQVFVEGMEVKTAWRTLGKGAFTLILLPEVQRLAAAGAEFAANRNAV